MDPHATDTNAAKKPLLVLEYQPVQRRRRSRLTGWDWSLIVAVLWLVPLTSRNGNELFSAEMRTAMWGGVVLAGRMVVGVVKRDRSWWWILYLGLDLAMPWLVFEFAHYVITRGW